MAPKKGPGLPRERRAAQMVGAVGGSAEAAGGIGAAGGSGAAGASVVQIVAVVCLCCCSPRAANDHGRAVPCAMPNFGAGLGRSSWLRTNGVNTNGAAAKVMNFDRLGKKVHPGTLEKIKVG